MDAVEIIIKKRDRGELTPAEIQFFVEGLTTGRIPDYQVSAWAMAVLLNGMTPRETTDLTLAMAHSGEILDMTGVVRISVDKHSSGGVGDKTSLVVLPVVSACGLPVGKMSGRGLGFSGGTLDKMESIPGYRVDLTTEEFTRQLADVGIVLSGQSRNLAPADGKLYALRDVTGTVQSLPLIASSIMSKKIASGAHAVVLDVKTGVGAFMETETQARQLAELMVSIGKLAGRKVVALISDMNQPLGSAVGNAIEAMEAVETLRGGGPPDFREHCLVVASHMLALGEMAGDLAAARAMAVGALDGGAGLQKFRALVAAQGGDVAYIDDLDRLPRAVLVEVVTAPRSGYLSQVHARLIGKAALQLGAGRHRKEDAIDHAVGIHVHHKVGDHLEQGDALFTIHAGNEGQLEIARRSVVEACRWSEQAVEPLPLFYGSIIQ